MIFFVFLVNFKLLQLDQLNPNDKNLYVCG